MLSKIVSAFFVAAIILITTAFQTAHAQCTPPSQRTWFAVNDNGAGKDTLWFGHSGSATYGLDGGLCEIELPPPPPNGVFDARMVNKPGREGQDTPGGMGQGFKQDYRQFTAGVSDTHRVSFKPGDGGFPFTFRWSPAGVLAMCDSAWFQDEFGGFIFRFRMHVDAQGVVANPAFSSGLLIRFGAIGTSVQPINDLIPETFGLEQNYPNPFNPSTTIQFSVERFAKTDIAVFDILGRKVATLVSEQLAPGFYSVKWDGKNDLGASVASGVYLLRMNALGENNVTFSSVRKLMLAK